MVLPGHITKEHFNDLDVFVSRATSMLLKFNKFCRKRIHYPKSHLWIAHICLAKNKWDLKIIRNKLESLWRFHKDPLPYIFIYNTLYVLIKMYTFDIKRACIIYTVDLNCIHIFRQFILTFLFLELVIFVLNERFSFHDETII